MWLIAPEFTIQPLQSLWLETSKAWLLLPWSMRVVVDSFLDSTYGIIDNWDSVFAKVGCLDPLATSICFHALSSFHYSGYLCNLKHVSRVCFMFPRRE